ncbi:MAG: DUF2059 domain-containing protein [Thiovulaceae bacterium]|nr:DUF2059 domain-containing protein [Sulfurimonadaceae bacterium]
MNIKKIITLFLLSFTFIFAANAQLTYELYKASGLKKQVQLFAPTMKYQIDQAKKQDATLQNLPTEFMTKINGLVDGAFSAKNLESTLLNYMSQRMSQRQIKEVTSWYKTPLGKKCVRLENDASSIDALQKMGAFMQTLQSKPLTATRIKLLQKFSKVLDFDQRTKTLAIDASTVMLRAFTSSMPQEQRPTVFQIRNQIKMQMEQNQAAFDQTTFISLAFTYKNLNANEINSYIKFVNTAAGKSFIKTSYEALSAAITQGSKSI